MKAVFADAHFYVALVNADDESHETALAWAGRLRRRMVVTEYVLLELGSFLAKMPHRTLFLNILDLVYGDPNTKVLRASSTLLNRGITLFRARTDKEWSLTDCISFDVMRSLKLTEALTADHHFEQAGFRALLKS